MTLVNGNKNSRNGNLVLMHFVSFNGCSELGSGYGPPF